MVKTVGQYFPPTVNRRNCVCWVAQGWVLGGGDEASAEGGDEGPANDAAATPATARAIRALYFRSAHGEWERGKKGTMAGFDRLILPIDAGPKLSHC